MAFKIYNTEFKIDVIFGEGRREQLKNEPNIVELGSDKEYFGNIAKGYREKYSHKEMLKRFLKKWQTEQTYQCITSCDIQREIEAMDYKPEDFHNDVWEGFWSVIPTSNPDIPKGIAWKRVARKTWYLCVPTKEYEKYVNSRRVMDEHYLFNNRKEALNFLYNNDKQ